jgi:hypothetical protein
MARFPGRGTCHYLPHNRLSLGLVLVSINQWCHFAQFKPNCVPAVGKVRPPENMLNTTTEANAFHYPWTPSFLIAELQVLQDQNSRTLSIKDRYTFPVTTSVMLIANPPRQKLPVWSSEGHHLPGAPHVLEVDL